MGEGGKMAGVASVVAVARNVGVAEDGEGGGVGGSGDVGTVSMGDHDLPPI